jgi:peptide/nickel transport system permease protein
MIRYSIRRLLYALPILLGINLATFVLFFVVNSPDDMARAQLGDKRVSEEAVERWKSERGYDLPLLLDSSAAGVQRVTHTILFQRSLTLFSFRFGSSDSGRDIGEDIRTRMWPSLAVALPTLLIGVTVNVLVALGVVSVRGSLLDRGTLVAMVALMSISALFLIIGAQYLFAIVLRWVPVSGYADGLSAARFVALPVAVGVVSGLGGGVRWYRNLFLEEVGKDYVRTARAKGLRERVVFLRHLLPNGLIPILTGIVVVLPTLFMGSLITESFFAIPGLGSYTIDALRNQDFAIVRAMVFLGSVLYMLGLLLTDLCYALVDPRIRLD